MTKDLPPTPAPSAEELATWVLQAPPLTGLDPTMAMRLNYLDM